MAFCRTGVLATVFDTFQKPFPRQSPWLDYTAVVGDASSGLVSMSGFTLANWTLAGACGRGTAAFRQNPSSVDLNPVQQVCTVALRPEHRKK